MLEFASRPYPIRQPAWVRGSFGRSLACAWSGLQYAFATQRNLRAQLAIGVAALALGALARLPRHELALVFALSAFVVYAELINTAIERALDHHAGLAYDPSVKLIKDLAAGSVLVVALAAGALGVGLFVPHVKPLLARLGLSFSAVRIMAGLLCVAAASTWAWRIRPRRAAPSAFGRVPASCDA